MAECPAGLTGRVGRNANCVVNRLIEDFRFVNPAIEQIRLSFRLRCCYVSRGCSDGGVSTMLRFVVMFGALMCAAVPAFADWELSKKKDPFTGQGTADMLTVGEEGWGVILSVGCATHGYLAVTVITREATPPGFSSSRQVPIDVKVDEMLFANLAGEVYATQMNVIGMRTLKSSAGDVRKVLAALKGAKTQFAIRMALLNGFAMSSVDGSTRAAEVVDKSCQAP